MPTIRIEARAAIARHAPDAPAARPRLYVDRVSVWAGEILSRLGLERVDSPDRADLLWIRRGYRHWYLKLREHQALNHIPFEGALTRKGALTANLHAHGHSDPQAAFSHRDFYQPTYRLGDPAERAAFVAQLPEKDSPDNVWILKPSTLSQGIGIRIGWQLDWLREALRRNAPVEFMYEGRPAEYIAQRYISNVLLLNGRKSELRIYWLIACLDPLLVLMYREGTARLTSREYKLGDFDDPLIHITNIYQQKKHGGVQADTELKWDFPRLQDYLAREKSARPDYLAAELVPRLKQILAYVVRAGESKLRQTPPSGHFFGLLGADVILDDRLTPWLTEIQTGPGLSCDDPVKQRVIPAMLQGAVNIVLDVLARKKSGRSMIGLAPAPGYEWVIGP